MGIVTSLKISAMKTTITINESDLQDIVKQYLAKRLEIAQDSLTNFQLHLKTKTDGDFRDSWTISVFDKITVDVANT